MFRTTLRSISAHKLRLLATSLAIIVGVAFVTGTLILSDTLRGTFDEVFGQANAGIDVAVEGPETGTDPFTGEGRHDPVPVDLVDTLAGIDGVSAVSPEVSGTAQLIDDEGEPVGGFGPPTIGFSAPVTPELDTPEIREGSFPTEPGQIAIDVGTARAQGFEVGDNVDMVIDGPVRTFNVSGLVGFGDLDSMAGATIVVFEPDEAFDLFADGGYDIIYLVGEEGVDPLDLRQDVAAALGSDYEVQTGAQLSDSMSAEVGEGLGFFTTALLVFAAVSLFVGAFLIANTFSIIVAQRTRELALLRAVGASRRQIMASVLGEALATGLIGSLVGFLAGLGLALGLFALLDAFGLSLPEGDLVVTPGTFLVAVVLGTVLTVVVAVFPAARSTRVAPVEALQTVAAPPPRRNGIIRYVFGGLLFVGGVVALGVTIAQGTGIAAVGAGAVVTLLGAALLAPLVTRPLLAAMGAPLSAGRGIQGQLATENALRNPRRTAATASALMIGLALVSFIVIMAASFTATADAAIDESFAGDFQIAQSGFTIPQGNPGPQLEEEVGAVDGVATATTQLFGQAEVNGTETFVSAMDPEGVEDALALQVIAGGEGGVLGDGLAVSEGIATDEGINVGDPVQITIDNQSFELDLGTVYEDSPITNGWLIGTDRVPADAHSLVFGGVFVELAADAAPDTVRARIDTVLEQYPTLQLQDLTEIKAEINGAINQLLGIVSALLGLSVIVALFGIINTLGLSVFERTRELGLLRAVGATRGQVRSMIRWESVLIALLGALFGLILGVLFAWLVVVGLEEDAGLQLAIPAGPLLGGLVAAAVAGVLAAIIPARRASRVDVLRAIQAQ